MTGSASTGELRCSTDRDKTPESIECENNFDEFGDTFGLRSFTLNATTKKNHNFW